MQRSLTKFLTSALLSMLCMNGAARSEDEPPSDADPVAATVNGKEVYRSEVLRTLAATLKGRDAALDAESRAKMLASVLEEMIDQRLVCQFLKAQSKVADDKTVVAEIVTIGKQLEKLKKDWPEHLKENGYTKATFRRQIEWRLSWQAYLEATLTDKVLEDYFVSHVQQYDGGEVRASHILLRADGEKSGESMQKQVDQAANIRKQIVAGELTFADAAKKYSHGPSRLRGGDIGYFPRRGVQGDEFSRAAFELQRDDISKPVVTPFGVHLIQTTDIRPGRIKWTDVRAQLTRDATRELFERIAKQQRAAAKIEYTKVIPHFEK